MKPISMRKKWGVEPSNCSSARSLYSLFSTLGPALRYTLTQPIASTPMRTCFLSIPVLTLLLMASCQENSSSHTNLSLSETSPKEDVIFYASLNRAIHQGQYGGTMTVADLLRHGDHGVGSTDRLAYELVITDGKAYGIPADGKAYELPDTTRIPFAAVKIFRSDQKQHVSGQLNLQDLETFLDSLITRNAFAAVRIKGRFPSIRYRSFQPQQRPYLPTDEVPNVVFTRSNLEATLVGFYTPASAEVINSPVYHFHFVDRERTTGGHVLDLIVAEADIEVDYADGLRVSLPDTSLLKHINLAKSSMQ
jgi:acetolactate decarboxylase